MIAAALSWLLLIAGAALFVPAAWLLTELIAATRQRPEPAPREALPIRVGVLIPAHNESSTLAATLEHLTPQLTAADVLLVVADNCTDDTAAIARRCGAQVLVRTDSVRRGKSFALAAGLQVLQPSGVEVVLIIDADCIVGPGMIRTVSELCHREGRPVQSLYHMAVPAQMSLSQRIRQFAWIVKTSLRPLGLRQLRLPCPLMGTGMAFPTALLSRFQLASGHIAEDLKLYIDLCRAGTPPLLCPSVEVTSTFPSSAEGQQTQRRRWEHGHLDLLFKEAPRLLAQGLGSLRPVVVSAALDLCIPPLALLSMALALLLAASALLWLMTGLLPALALAALDALLLGTGIAIAWALQGRQVLSARHLLYVPLYVLAKIPLYVQFLVARESRWIRSRRQGD